MYIILVMKRIVICCDGTWNTPDQKDRGVMRPTNVVKMAHIVLPQAPDGIEQRVYYDKGVGTGSSGCGIRSAPTALPACSAN